MAPSEHVSIRCRFRLNVSSFTFTVPRNTQWVLCNLFLECKLLQLINIALRERTQWTSWTFCDFPFDISEKSKWTHSLNGFNIPNVYCCVCDLSKFNWKAIRLIKIRNNTGDFTRWPFYQMEFDSIARNWTVVSATEAATICAILGMVEAELRNVFIFWITEFLCQ